MHQPEQLGTGAGCGLRLGGAVTFICVTTEAGDALAWVEQEVSEFSYLLASGPSQRILVVDPTEDNQRKKLKKKLEEISSE